MLSAKPGAKKKTRQKYELTRVKSPNSSLSACCLSFENTEGSLKPVLEVAAPELIKWFAGVVDTETDVLDDAWAS